MGVSGFTGVLLDGAVGAATLTTSKIATRTVPELFKQDRTSNVGLGVQLATAVAFGFLADMVAGPSWGTWVLAGALTAPLEDAAVRFQVPYVADKLQPGTGGTVGIYASRRGRPRASVRAPAPTSRRLPAARGMADWITPFIGNGAGVSA